KDYGIKGTQTVITYTVYIGEKSLFTFRTFVYDIEDGQIKEIYNTQKKRYEKNTALYDALKTECRITLSLTEPEFDGDKPVTVEDFEYCINSEGGITLKKYIGDSLFVTVPAEIDGLPVTEIGNDCFREWMAYFLTKVTVPDTVKRIGDRAFYCCEQLKSVDLPEGISIGADAFTGTPLAHLNPHTESTPEDTVKHTVFNGLEKEFGKAVGEKEFIIGSEYTCLSSLKNIASTVTVTVPETVTKIDCGGGKGCTLIIKGAAEIVRLGDSYKTVVIENPNVKISPKAFYGTSIEALILPEGLTEIGEYAFAFAKIDKVTIPASVESIGKYAFVCFEGDVDVANASKLASVSELACIEGVASASLKDDIDNAVITDTKLDSEKYTQVLNKGYQINGTNLFIPFGEAYFAFEDDPDFRVFATKDIIPSDGELQTINGGAYEKDGKIYFSFANGTDDVLLDIDIFANGENPQVSITSSYVCDTYGYGTINISHGSKPNKYGYVVRCSGKYSSVFEIPSYYYDFMMLDEYVGFYHSDVFPALGSRIVYVYVTVDGGKTFANSGNVAEYIFGGPVTGIAYPNAVLPNYRFVGSALPPSFAMDYLTKVTPANYDLHSAVHRSGYTHSIRTETPVFEGDIGLCRHQISFVDKSGNSHTYYMYTVSFDGGESWEVFEPHLFGSLPEHNICVSVDTCTDGGVTYEKIKGVIRIKGSDKIIMPSVAEFYISAYDYSTLLFDEGYYIDTDEEIPLYRGVFNASHDFYELGDISFVSYYGGENIVEIPKTLKDQNGNELEAQIDKISKFSYDKFDYYVSEKLTWFYWDNVLMFSTDMCKSFTVYSFENDIDNVTWLADGSIYVVCRNGKRFAEGTEYSAFCSADGGHSFKKENTVERENSFGLVINGKEYRVPIINRTTSYRTYNDCAAYKMLVDGKEAVFPAVKDESSFYGSLATMPYFDGDIAIWTYYPSHHCQTSLPLLLVSIDGGESWHPYLDNEFTSINYASWVFSTGK
ncbi:MAG: leucine-rich repeat domain-containing protein, partial [Clostridia bacterium]|nr:leucine-rich repeat domain-containing protein [Clostridia bacterium]